MQLPHILKFSQVSPSVGQPDLATPQSLSELQLSLFSAHWPWTQYSAFLTLTFLICKTGTIILPCRCL